MSAKRTLFWLFPIMIGLAVVTALSGLLWLSNGAPVSFTPLRGEEVFLAGQGLYQYDTVFHSGAFMGADWITLLVILPLGLVTYLRFRQGKPFASLVLSGLTVFCLYNAFSLTFMTSYNPLFPVYILYLSASLYGFILSVQTNRALTLEKRGLSALPHGRIAAFCIFAGLGTVFIWSSELVPSVIDPTVIPQHLAHYTTLVTHALDIGVIAPAAFICAYFFLKKDALAYPLGFPLIFLNALIGLVVLAQTIVQLNLGIQFSTGQLIGMIGSWIILSGFALWILLLFRKRINPV